MRTDRTTVCLRCRVRIRPLPRCPVCRASDGLRDLREPGPREEATTPGAAPSSGAPREATGWALQFGFLMAGLVILFLAMLTFGGAIAGGELHLAVLLVILGGSILFFVALSMRAPTRAGPFRLLPGPVALDDAPRDSVEGVAQGEERLTGPLSGTPCLAFRLVGEGPLGPIDDAHATRFTVALAGGGKAPVLGDPGGYELPIEGAPAQVELAALRGGEASLAFLRERGGDPARGPLRLAEGLLRAGDRVAVEGAPGHLRGDGGYRVSTPERALVDAPGSPLRVRRLPPSGSPPAPPSEGADPSADDPSA